MKNTYKIISLLILCTVLISGLCVEIFAQANAPITSPGKDNESLAESENDLVISKDYKKISYKGYYFSLVDPAFHSILRSVHKSSSFLSCEIRFSSEDQLNNYDYVEPYLCKTDDNKPFYIMLTIEFTNGQYETFYYLNIDYVKELSKALTGEYTDAYVVSNNKVYVKRYMLTSNSVIPGYPTDYYHGEIFKVYSYSDNFTVLQGCVYKADSGAYYYFDLSLNEFTVGSIPALMNYNSIKVYAINDRELISLIEAPYSPGGADDFDEFDEFLNSDAMSIISIVLLCLASGILPFAGAIVCFIKGAKASSPYRALLNTIAIICTVVVLFVVLIIVFSLL